MADPKANQRKTAFILDPNSVSEKLFDAIQYAWENDIWPSSKNLAILMGYKIQKLNGQMNRERIKILRDHFYL